MQWVYQNPLLSVLHLFDFSAAIMRYLVSKYNLPDHWYPTDPECRAKVDEYLDWHHTNTRAGAAMFFASQVQTCVSFFVTTMAVFVLVCDPSNYRR